jgi:hypothetical protein
MSPQDLLLQENELNQLTAALANSGVDTPLETVIAEADQKVTDYTSAFQISDARRARLTRALAIWEAYHLVGVIPANHQEAYEAAMRELEAIRDGKFQLPPADDPPATPAGAGAWGSKCRII